jgi:hypothetical protein
MLIRVYKRSDGRMSFTCDNKHTATRASKNKFLTRIKPGLNTLKDYVRASLSSIVKDLKKTDCDICIKISVVYPFLNLYCCLQISNKYGNVTDDTLCRNYVACLVSCGVKNKRISPLSLFHGCRKRRLKD